MTDNTVSVLYYRDHLGKVHLELEADPSKVIILTRNHVPFAKIQGLTEVEILEILAREARIKDLELQSKLRKARKDAGYTD